MEKGYETIGKTASDYSEIERKIACLEKQMGDIGQDLLALGKHLRDSPSSVTVGDRIEVPYEGWSVATQPEPTPIPLTSLSIERLRSLSQELRDATAERQRLCSHLSRMGLGNLVQER